MSGRSEDATNYATTTDKQEDAPAVNAADSVTPGGYDVLAEIRISHPDLILSPTIDAVSGLTVTPDLRGYAPGSPLYVTVTGDDFDRFESALATDHTVFSPTLVDEAAGRRVYAVEPQRERTVISTIIETDAYLVEMKSGNSGWIVCMRVPSRETLSNLRDDLRERDITFEVRRILDTDSIPDDDDRALTKRQRDVLMTAFQAGYYEVPRRCTQSELADELAVSTAAVSQRVRRATKRLLETTEIADVAEGVEAR